MLNKPTPEQILAAAEIELGRILKRLIVCRNQQYRETGRLADDLGAVIARTEFLLRDIMTGLISPVAPKTEAVVKRLTTRIQ
jgi:hypothetical protein